MTKSSLALLFWICLAVPVHAADAADVTRSRVEYVMGTMLEVRVAAADSTTAGVALDTAFAVVHRLDSTLSNYRSDSEISRMAASAPAPVPVSDDTFEFVRRSLELAELSGGAFDPTVGSLVAMWGFYSGDYRIPAEADLERARASVGYRRVRLDERAQTVALDSGVIFDPGGAGKGFALERAQARLEAMGVRSFYFDFGGQVYRQGSDTVGIAVRHPRADTVSVTEVYFASGSVATSGDYERYFEMDGVRYAHVIDPRTGRPVVNRYAVSVFAPDPWMADVLSTALYVLGSDAGATLLEHFPGVGAMYLSHDGAGWYAGADSTWRALESR